LKKNLPPGYQLQIGGEKAKQVDGFTNLAVVLLISLVGIYLALLVQFKNAVKPLLVFAAAPYGAIGALIALALMGPHFGVHAIPWSGEPHWSYGKPRHRVVRLHGRDARKRRATRTCPTRCGHRAPPARIDYRECNNALFPLALE